MKEKYKQIINHYGIKSQHKYWYSEIQELSESITEYEIFKNLSIISVKIIKIEPNVFCPFVSTYIVSTCPI